MAIPMFSTYSTAENRVTSTILAVFERLNTATVTRILQVLMEDSTIELVEYVNQIKTSESTPDGRIKGLFDYVIETKIVPNKIQKDQIENHCKVLKYDFSKLLVLTPDYDYPEILKKVNPKYKDRVVWGNFDKIIDGINSVLEEHILLLEKEKFLLIELRDFLINEKLTSEDYSRKAVIVPAGFAWGFYQKYSIYRCQANRAFQLCSYMGFYADREIKKYFPRILGFIDSLNLQTDDLNSVEIKTINGLEANIVRDKLIQIKENLSENEWNDNYKYFVLTNLDDKETFKLDEPIKNNKMSYSEKGTAFVQKQTYINLDGLIGKKFTTELE